MKHFSQLGSRYLAFIILLCSCTTPLRADGGAVQISEVKGPYRISVFTSPTPLSAGPIDVSVLVQDASSGTAILDADVTIKLNPAGRPNELLAEPATRAAATNKILQAAAFQLPQGGPWEIRVIVQSALGKEEVHCEVEVGEPWPEWLSLLPWILWPLVPIALFVIHVALVKRRQTVGSSTAMRIKS